jgi:hypothetical protein
LDLKTQVKQILKVVQELAPGRSVELRIPPYAAIQCVGGSTHRRGTPPNVVEMSAETLLKLLENLKIKVKDGLVWNLFQKIMKKVMMICLNHTIQ